MRRVHVCAVIGCGELAPCPQHARDTSGHRSPDRDREAQKGFRRLVLHAAGYACERCGSSEQLVAHHLRPGYELEHGQCLCSSCHREVDPYAR